MSHPPLVQECLDNITDYLATIKPNDKGEKNVEVTDILWIIAQFDQEVEDYLQRTQTPISMDGLTSIRLHCRPRESANDN